MRSPGYNSIVNFPNTVLFIYHEGPHRGSCLPVNFHQSSSCNYLWFFFITKGHLGLDNKLYPYFNIQLYALQRNNSNQQMFPCPEFYLKKYIMQWNYNQFSDWHEMVITFANMAAESRIYYILSQKICSKFGVLCHVCHHKHTQTDPQW